MGKSKYRSRDWNRLLRSWRLGPASGTIGAMKYIRAHRQRLGGWLILADCGWSMARYARARWALRRAEWVAPERVHDRLHEQWGLYYREKNDLKKAELSFRRSVDALPSTRHYVLLGEILAKQGRRREAEDMFRQAIRMRAAGESLDHAHFNLGLMLRARGRYKEAATHFRTTLRIDPRYMAAKQALRDVRNATAPPAKGLSRREAWRQLRSLWPKSAPATLAKVAARFTRTYPRCHWGWIMLAHGLWSMDRHDEALKSLRQAQRVAPRRERATVYVHRGWFFRDKCNLKRAESWFRRAVRVEPTTGNYVFLGCVLAKQGKLKEAERIHRRAITTRTRGDAVDEAHLNLGLVLRALMRNREAATHFKAALRIDPRYQAAHTALRDVIRARAEHAAYRSRDSA